jgi:hypothetical protein
MKVMNVINCRNFAICCGHATANESIAHPNTLDKNTQMQFYLAQGYVNVSNGVKDYDLPLREWFDLSEFKNDSKLTYTTNEQGCAWVLILPENNTDEYTVTSVSDGTVSAAANSFLLVTDGEKVKANGLKLKHLNYVPLDKDVVIELNGGSVHKFTVK